MRSLRVKLAVAAWEFRRFYKLRDQILSLMLAILGGAVGLGIQYFVAKSAGAAHVAVLYADRLPDVVLPKPARSCWNRTNRPKSESCARKSA